MNTEDLPYRNPSWLELRQAVYIGIDPGQSGAIAAIYPDGRVQVWCTPTMKLKTRIGTNPKTKKPRFKQATLYDEPGMVRILYQFYKLRKEGYKVHVVLEEVSSMPRDGVVQAFKFGMGYGMWRGILAAVRLPYTLIRPATWKPPMVGVGADKTKSRLVCMRLFPDVELPKKKDSDKAEAILLAEYFRRKEHSEPMPQSKKAKLPKPKPVKKKVPTVKSGKPTKKKVTRGKRVSAFWSGFEET